MELIVLSAGSVRGLYDEALDLAALGHITIRRASHVEPDEWGRWKADLAPVAGARLGPFTLRSQALVAEISWLSEHWLAVRRLVLGAFIPARSRRFFDSSLFP